MEMEKIAILITTVHRDNLLMDTLRSILEVYQDNWIILIGDQNPKESYSTEKSFFYQTACAEAHYGANDRIKIVKLPFNCGLSYARNRLVEKANEMGIKYCILGADSVEFDKSMSNIHNLIHYMRRYDIIGLDILNRVKWEAKMRLVEGSHFELDFINTACKTCSSKKLVVYNCDICRNFFLAKTQSLLNNPWDEDLYMKEHEVFFYNIKKSKLKVGYTNNFKGTYVGEKSKKDGSEYSKLRNKNMAEGLKKLKEKYNIKKWVEYKNLENIHKR